jgi:hypothetical protein
MLIATAIRFGNFQDNPPVGGRCSVNRVASAGRHGIIGNGKHAINSIKMSDYQLHSSNVLKMAVSRRPENSTHAPEALIPWRALLIAAMRRIAAQPQGLSTEAISSQG